jgi:type II secretory pathway pseudopilin PulG
MKTKNTAFTFVELIVSVGIILLVSTVGYISYTGNIDTKDNAKVTSDLATLDNSFKSYLAETKTLPEANGNKSFYKAD